MSAASPSDDTPRTGDGKPVEQKWTNPFVPGTYLHDLFDRRIRANQDLVIVIDDYHARRGTGKTVSALQLANGMDQTAEGITKTKVSLRPEEIREAYAEEPKRSGLVLDEAEVGASKWSAMTNVNKALREIMSMGRIEEKYVVLNAPSFSQIDKEVQMLADVWICMTRRGQAIVHGIELNPYAGQILKPKKQLIEFRDISKDHDLRDVYRYLTREKRRRIAGEEGDGFIPRKEAREWVEKAKKEQERQTRDQLIEQFYGHEEVREAGIPQRVVADAAGVSQQTVAKVLNEDA